MEGTAGRSRSSFRNVVPLMYPPRAQIRLSAPGQNLKVPALELSPPSHVSTVQNRRLKMGFGKGALLWLIGIPLPIILLLAIFMHH